MSELPRPTGFESGYGDNFELTDREERYRLFNEARDWLTGNEAAKRSNLDNVIGMEKGVPVVKGPPPLASVLISGEALRQRLPEVADYLRVGSEIEVTYAHAYLQRRDDGDTVYEPPRCEFIIEKEAALERTALTSDVFGFYAFPEDDSLEFHRSQEFKPGIAAPASLPAPLNNEDYFWTSGDGSEQAMAQFMRGDYMALQEIVDHFDELAAWEALEG